MTAGVSGPAAPNRPNGSWAQQRCGGSSMMPRRRVGTASAQCPVLPGPGVGRGIRLTIEGASHRRPRDTGGAVSRTRHCRSVTSRPRGGVRLEPVERLVKANWTCIWLPTPAMAGSAWAWSAKPASAIWRGAVPQRAQRRGGIR